MITSAPTDAGTVMSGVTGACSMRLCSLLEKGVATAVATPVATEVIAAVSAVVINPDRLLECCSCLFRFSPFISGLSPEDRSGLSPGGGTGADMRKSLFDGLGDPAAAGSRKTDPYCARRCQEM
ncbi:hypothetical protein [Microbispora sp. GKU 823]|uniref:hypothetical protein n=1 Tax=Microbispora sp. GKU 823 TaxID=1652100 RepID=UPI00117F0280|nr:hypothetical protein [Microbispora sp. GKU 823]